MRKIVLSILLTFFCLGSVFSQIDVQLSQYMFHNSQFNPATVGVSDMIQIVGHHRYQWLGFPNAGQTTLFSINSPLKIGKNKQGIGVKFMNDKAGLFSNQSAQIQYAYKKTLNKGVLSVGADIGFVSIGFRGDSVNVANHVINIGEYHNIAADQSIPQTSVNGMALDVNLGVFYSTPKYYAGLSFMHINKPKVNLDDKTTFDILGTTYFTSGGTFALSNPRYVFKPSTLLKTDFISFQLDLSGYVEYNSKYWGGLSYRFQDAIGVLAGLNLASGLSIGYSYDLPTSKIITASSGSHEVILLYNFAYVFAKRNSKFKSIRIL